MDNSIIGIVATTSIPIQFERHCSTHTLAPAQDELKMRCHRRSRIILGYIYLCLNIRITHHWNGTFLCLSINEVRLGKYISVSFMCKCRITKYK